LREGLGEGATWRFHPRTGLTGPPPTPPASGRGEGYSVESSDFFLANRFRATSAAAAPPNSRIIGGAGTGAGPPELLPPHPRPQLLLPWLLDPCQPLEPQPLELLQWLLDPFDEDEVDDEFDELVEELFDDEVETSPLELVDELVEVDDETSPLDEEEVEDDTSPLEDEVELTWPLDVEVEEPPVEVEVEEPPVEVEEPPVEVEVEPPDEDELDEEISMLMPLEPLLLPEDEPPKKPPAKKPPMKPPPPEPPITPEEDEPLLLDETIGISP